VSINFVDEANAAVQYRLYADMMTT